MRKVTKQQQTDHDRACAILEQPGVIAPEDVEFVLQNWHPTASGNNAGVNGAFFTPPDLCRDVAQLAAANSRGPHYLDLCAGIGGLTWWLYKYNAWTAATAKERTTYTCVEINQEYVAVGKRLMPWARWVCGDAYDLQLLNGLGMFDMGVSNPPFNKVASAAGTWLSYQGKADLMACEVLARVRQRQAFVIMPNMSLPWDSDGNVRADANLREYRKWRQGNVCFQLSRTSIAADNYEFVGAKSVQFDVAELCVVED